jgi:uncharacterized protein (TIGR03083 family)
MDMNAEHLVDLGLDVVEAPVPLAVRGRVLEAVAERPRSAWPAVEHGITAQTAFLRTAAEVGGLLDDLGPDEWHTPTAVTTATVHDLVRHLVGVERYIHGQLGLGPTHDAPRRADHYAVADTITADLIGADPDRLRAAWWREVMTSLAASSSLGPDHPVTFHHLGGSLRGLLIVRTFELWTHGEDIGRATGRPQHDLGDERLALMSSELMTLLATGMQLAGGARPGRTARFELTGPGGGEHVVALTPGATAGPVDIAISTDTADLCRLAADRISPDDLEVRVEGDITLLEPILVGASAFALD